ncbi:hypothetical protein EMIT0P2_50261 [Pseudomonas sp. IT-P2]
MCPALLGEMSAYTSGVSALVGGRYEEKESFPLVSGFERGLRSVRQVAGAWESSQMQQGAAGGCGSAPG